MATDQKVPLEKIVKLIEAAKLLHVQAGDLLVEIDALLGGKVGIAEEMRALAAAFEAAWSARYAGRYVWAHSRDRPAMKRLIKNLGIDEVERRVVNYLANDDPFYTRARHPFALFVGSINSHAGEGTVREFVPGCLHTPPCTSDAQHTKVQSDGIRRR